MRLSERAYRHIKTLLLNGHYHPRDWLPVDDIATELGASRQPVMDAIKQLAQEGFVEVVPQAGCRIPTPDPREVDDFYHLLASGEALIADLVAQRCTEDDLLNLELIYEQINRVINSKKKNQEKTSLFKELNQRFHFELRQICNSPLLIGVVQNLSERSDFYLALRNSPFIQVDMQKAQKDHKTLLDALRAKNGKKAHGIMEEHILAAEHFVLNDE